MTTELDKLLLKFENALAYAWSQDEHVSYKRGRDLHSRVDAARQELVAHIEGMSTKPCDHSMDGAP